METNLVICIAFLFNVIVGSFCISKPFAKARDIAVLAYYSSVVMLGAALLFGG